jgi:hypothetical protein
LIEEIKRRGRMCVSSGDLRSADALYGKGIDVLLLRSSSSSSSVGDGDGDGGAATTTTTTTAATTAATTARAADLAMLRSNRSLVRLRMGRSAEALEDATLACADDPTYVKAHWRRGQAASRCGDADEALDAFERALMLEPDNGALRKEVDVARERKAREEEELTMAASVAASAAAEEGGGGGGDAETKDDGRGGTGDATTTAPPKQQQRRQDPTPPSSSSTSKEEEQQAVAVDESSFTKSDHLRGYKIRSDGTKTSFFDREISDDARRLIGDIAPKKLDGVDRGGGGAPAPTAAVAEGASAWNKAGTWEERDVTPWARETLSASLLGASYVLPGGSPSPGAVASIVEVVGLDGNASHASVRGKKKYIYEFSISVRWELALPSSSSSSSSSGGGDGNEVVRCRGEMTFPDVDGTVEPGEGYDVSNYSVDGTTCPPGIGPVLDRFVKDGGLRDELHGAIDGWVTLFRATY